MKVARNIRDPLRALGLIWDNFQELVDLGFSESKLVTLEPSAGANTVYHGLGRRHQGYLVVRSVDCSVDYEHAGTADDTTFDLEVTVVGSSPSVAVRVW